jgi:hypothetical protein
MLSGLLHREGGQLRDLYRLDRRYIGRDILTVVGGCFGGDIVPNYNRPFRAAHVFWLRHAPA